MTSAGLPSEHTLSAWHLRFPNRRHLWAGRVRIWHVELPVRSPTSSVLTEWVRKATADGVPLSAAARRLGLPGPVVAALHPDNCLSRQAFTFLDLPAGPRCVASVAAVFEPWPGPIAAVQPAILHPPEVEVVPMSGDWRTIPIVRAEAADVVAVWLGDRIEVYAAADPDGPALWQLPADALPAAGQEL